CRAEHPTLTELAKTMPVYGIDLKDPEANALRFLAQDGDPYHALATDPNGRGAIEWGVTAPPETFILDGEGRVLHRHAGPLIREDYTQRFLPQLEKALTDQ
ncbi:MAG: DsbE family thiol:disulfide interchange protein, partial [Paracoccus sp. (in: a-proteobacteria)]|nr:DsbE family thiol:disulfide interchange protein [Paracoccus sp. (in: a-proteobacteria)]